ncbi:Mitochondrial 2-oxoadipate and 2-oxoglutarate transporter [Allomyces arbusculus]|nr:Mitochondrial 2-oxoadipate and 2-oxoglutarate transporter [Allomyces arbusculus]
MVRPNSLTPSLPAAETTVVGKKRKRAADDFPTTSPCTTMVVSKRCRRAADDLLPSSPTTTNVSEKSQSAADDLPTTSPATVAAIPHTKPAPALLRDILSAQLKQQPAANDTSILVADVGHIYRQYNQWCEYLPSIEPFYAVKCNTAPVVLETLVRAGVGFDIASKWELDQVLAAGASPAKIIYANPYKPVSHLRHAAASGVRLMTFDTVGELHKIRAHHPNPQLVLRMMVGAGHARIALDTVGVDPQYEARTLLLEAKRLEIDVVGVAFHVGTGCFNARVFQDAVASARSVFTTASELGFNMTLLDVGGGFPGGPATDPCDGHDGPSFVDMAAALRDAIAREFANTSVRVIAEPGRYFVAHAYHLAVNVIGHRMHAPTSPNALPRQHLRLCEGAFTLFGPGNHPRGPYVIVKDGEVVEDLEKFSTQGQLFPTTCFGPTCAPIDVVADSCMLPDLQPGDWLLFDVMGAYSVSMTTGFNGFRHAPVVWTNTEAAVLTGTNRIE